MSRKTIQLKSGEDYLYPLVGVNYLGQYSDFDGANLGDWIKENFVGNGRASYCWLAKISTVTTNSLFGKSSFTIIGSLSSTNYGWALLLSDSPTHNGMIFGRLTGNSWVWKEVSLTAIS